ncbi:hypothetical protein V8D89_005245 [Ganoderma adspersum]
MSSSTPLSLPDVPDVLYAIFSYLDPVHQSQYDQVYESRRSLALVARTYRGFAGPALDVLWKRLPDDQPLADLLCEVGIATRQEDEEHLQLLGENRPGRYQLPNQGGTGFPGATEAYEGKWRLSRGYDIQYLFRSDIGDPRKHPSWPRFAAYASRVRAITLFAFDGPAWCGIWEELRSRTGNVPILPNLLSVAFCRKSWAALTPGALALISPSVCSLNFNLGNENECPVLDEKLRILFSQCFNTAPKIDQLRLELTPSRLGQPLLQIHCSRIRRLEVYPQIDFEGLRVLTNLPTLQRLSIALIEENVPEANPTLIFKYLTKLDVEGTWTNLSTLLDTVRLPSMHMLSVTSWAYGEPAAELAQGAIQCFKTISARQISIPSLSIYESYGRVPPPRNGVVYVIPPVWDTFEAPFLDVVHPLLSLSSLRHFSLQLPRYCDLTCTTADLRAVAESFPALETFHLPVWFHPYSNSPLKGADLRARDRPRGPLTAIAHFARCCPRLRILHLPSMELTEESLAALCDEGNINVISEPHGLQTLIIPRVLVPPGRADLVGKVSEVIKGVFPLAASPFRPEKLVMEEDWAVAEGASSSRCPECSARLWPISTFL